MDGGWSSWGSTVNVAMDVVVDDARMDGVMRGFIRGLRCFRDSRSLVAFLQG